MTYAGTYVFDGKVVKVNSAYGFAEGNVKGDAQETAKELLTKVLNVYYSAPR